MSKPVDNRDYFESKEFAEAWDAKLQRRGDPLRDNILHPILLKDIKSLKGKIVLESGVGSGYLLKELLKLKPKEICADDISEHLIAISKKRYPGVNYKIVDLLKKLPYKNNMFNVTISSCVLMELPSINLAIKELSRVTKKGGQIYIAIVHPLYNLFMNDVKAKEETVRQRLERYGKAECLHVDTLQIVGNSKVSRMFLVHRRPISEWVNELNKNGLFIEKMLELIIPERMGELDEKYKERYGAPVFLYFKLKKM